MIRSVSIGLLVAAAGLPAGAIADVTVTSNGRQAIEGSGRIVHQARPVQNFSRIALEGAGDVEVRVGPAPSLSVEADDNLQPLLTSEVHGDTLVLGSHGSYRTRTTPRYLVTVPNLSGARSKGSGNVSITGVSNAGLELGIEGSGNMRAVGRTGRVDGNIRGSGNLELQGLSARDGRVLVMGSGNATVRVSGALDASVLGSGDVRYIGRPAPLAVHKQGSGRIVAISG